MRTTIIVVVLLLAGGALTYLMMTGSGGGSDGDVIATASGLQYIDLKIGTGREAKKGDTVAVHYTGKLKTGVKFDSSLDRGKPFTFSIGAGDVIKGWDEGVPGMKVGGRRKLIVPADLGYGSREAGDGKIPPNSTLVFDIELISVR